MRDEDWQQRWREGRTGWHEAGGSAALRRHWGAPAGGGRVLVPLCGKSPDLLWLARQGLAVTGVELSPLAVAAFFAEQGLDVVRDRDGGLERFRARELPLQIYCGDFFAYRAAAGRFDALYDRGALVAVSPDRRVSYARHCDNLLAPGAMRLVITLEYEQSAAAGPPWSVRGDELVGLWPGLTEVGRHNDIDNAPPKFRDAGLDRFDEVTWRSA